MQPALCRAGVTRPSVEIRFDDICADSAIPEVITKGLYTVGKDVMFKILVRTSSVISGQICMLSCSPD